MPEEEDEELQQARIKKEQEMQARKLASLVLEPLAFERLSRIRIANELLYQEIVEQLAAAVQTGTLKRKLTEEELRTLASQLMVKRETKITFHRKRE